MDLILPRTGILTKEREEILWDSFNSVDEMLSEKNPRVEYNDWKHQARKSYYRFHILKDIWPYLSRDQMVKESHYFYDCIFRCKRSNKGRTEWISISLYNENDKPGEFTADHPFTARLSLRCLMTEWPELMDNLDDFTEMINYISQTVGVSKKENQDVKVLPDQKGEIKLDQLTADKYANFTFKNKNTGEIKKGIPFDIPQWFCNGEKKRLIHEKDILRRDLKKNKLLELQEIANDLNITIIKPNPSKRKKTKQDLINDIITMRYHNDQMSP